MTDFLGAVRTYLLSQAEVTALCEQRVFVLALPPDEVESMPRSCVVLLASGQDSPATSRNRTVARIDVVCYGETDYAAAAMERPVAQALKDMRRTVVGSTLLHNATVSAGPFQARDPETGWPAMRRSATVRADEMEVA